MASFGAKLGGSTLIFKNVKVLDDIVAATESSRRQVAEAASDMASVFVEEFYGELDPVARDKVFVNIVPMGGGTYEIDLQTKTEASARTIKQNQRVYITTEGEVPKFRNVPETPSIDLWVAKEKEIAAERASLIAEEMGAIDVEQRLVMTYESLGVKFETNISRYRAPKGGVNIGGRFYKGGRFVPGIA